MNFNISKYKDNFLFIPLGGSNEIGMNLNLYHYKGKWLMVDCGVGFSYDTPGIDMMTPDISFLKQIKKDLIAIIITHIHEDHIGAIQYLWNDIGVDVYTSELAKNFLITKLIEFNLDKKIPIKVINNKKDLNIGPFNIEFIGLTHSVPEMQALYIKTDIGNILHTGDWKFDPNPIIGNISQKDKINQYGVDKKIDAIICDSTNSTTQGHSKSEGELYYSLKEIIAKQKAMVGVTTFASNIARITTIAKIATELNRKVVLAGFSLRRLYEVGKKSGYFKDDKCFISDKEIKFYDKSEILVICTGCQGEPLASTRKIASNIHPTIKFNKGDLMIFSSKIIPGNEKKIYEVYDIFAKRQIDVITEKDHFVHVSGHPYHDELVEMYQLAQPNIAIPVHGEFIHTKVNAEIATSQNVQKVIQPENGMVINIDFKDPKMSSQIASVPSGYLGVDGKNLISLDSPIIKQRKKLAYGGIVIISLKLDKSLKLTQKPYIRAVGSYDLEQEFLEDIIIEEIRKIIKNKSKSIGNNKFSFIKKISSNQYSNIANQLEKAILVVINKIFKDIMGKKPYCDLKIWI